MHATFARKSGAETQIVTGEKPIHTPPEGAKVRVLNRDFWPLVAAVLPKGAAPYSVAYDGETAPL